MLCLGIIHVRVTCFRPHTVGYKNTQLLPSLSRCIEGIVGLLFPFLKRFAVSATLGETREQFVFFAARDLRNRRCSLKVVVRGLELYLWGALHSTNRIGREHKPVLGCIPRADVTPFIFY
jgi:hypothetical protein